MKPDFERKPQQQLSSLQVGLAVTAISSMSLATVALFSSYCLRLVLGMKEADFMQTWYGAVMVWPAVAFYLIGFALLPVAVFAGRWRVP